MIAGLWRTFIAIFKATDPKAAAPVDPQAAFRAKRAAQKRDQRARKKAREAALNVSPTSGDMSPTVSLTVADTPKEREEERRKREMRARIPNDWRPNEEGVRIGAEVFGDWLENKITSHRAYWRTHDPPKNVDWDAMWLVECDRCKQRQLMLPLGAKPTITGDRNETAQGRRNTAGGSVAHYGRRRLRQVFGNEGG